VPFSSFHPAAQHRSGARGSAGGPQPAASHAPGCRPASPAPGSTRLGSLNSLEQDVIPSRQLRFLHCSLRGKIASWLITLFH